MNHGFWFFKNVGSIDIGKSAEEKLLDLAEMADSWRRSLAETPD